MSRVKQYAIELQNPPKLQGAKKQAVTIRIDKENVFSVDLLAEKFGVSRSAFVSDLVTAALYDVLEELNIREEFGERYTEHLREVMNKAFGEKEVKRR